MDALIVVDDRDYDQEFNQGETTTGVKSRHHMGPFILLAHA